MSQSAAPDNYAEEEEDESYTDEEELIEESKRETLEQEPKATGEVCEEKPLSVKEQIKNFANLKIQELLGPQAFSNNPPAEEEEETYDEEYHQEDEYVGHEEYQQEPEEYDYSIASETDQYSHPIEGTKSPSILVDHDQTGHQEESQELNSSDRAHQSSERLAVQEVVAAQNRQKSHSPVDSPASSEKIAKTPSPVNPPVSSPVATPKPVVIAPAPAPSRPPQPVAPTSAVTKPPEPLQPIYKPVSMEAKPILAAPMQSGGSIPDHQVETYRPPEQSADPFMHNISQQPKRAWKSGVGGAVQLASAGKGSKQAPQIYLGYEVVSQHSAGLMNVSLRRQHSDKQWGFTLYGGTEAGCPPFVNHVTMNSTAYQMGLEIGDVIQAICSLPCEGKSLYALKAEILRAGNELDFVVLKQGIDLTKLLQRAPQIVPQLLKNGNGHQQRPQPRGFRNNSWKNQNSGSFEDPDNVGIVSGMGIRPVQTRSLRILEEQLAKGVNPSSAIQTNQHLSSARGLSAMGEKSSYTSAYGQSANYGYAGRVTIDAGSGRRDYPAPPMNEGHGQHGYAQPIRDAYAPQGHQNYSGSGSYVVPTAQPVMMTPGSPYASPYEDRNRFHNPQNQPAAHYGHQPQGAGYYQQEGNAYNRTLHQEPMRTYPAYSTNNSQPYAMNANNGAAKSSVNLFLGPHQSRQQPQQYY